MRTSNRVTFIYETQGGYDPTQGGYVAGDEQRITRACHMSPMSAEKETSLFGHMKQEMTIVRLHGLYMEPYHRVEIGDKPYTVRRHVNYRNNTVLYVEGAG